MKRRAFVAGLGVGLAVAPGAGAQLAAMASPRLGFLGNSDSKTEGALLNGFREGLKDFGLIEGRTITIDYRWAEGNPDRLPSLAADLVRLRCDVIGRVRKSRGPSGSTGDECHPYRDPCPLG